MNASAPHADASNPATISSASQTTSRFRVPSSQVISALAMRHGPLWGSICAIPVVGALILGFLLDTRFFILALMVLMIFVPLVAAFLYFDHGLRQATALNTVDHSLCLSPQGMVVTVYPPERKSSDSDVLDPEAFRREAETPQPAQRDILIPYSDFSPYTVGLTSLILPAGARGLLLIPSGAFKSPASLAGFAEILSARCGWTINAGA
ncbi:MAG: hypothetical protein K2O24_08345 [Muribaculaceae bacterium]|nr:hypothetical protein [Muribaculaceae bacterium]